MSACSSHLHLEKLNALPVVHAWLCFMYTCSSLVYIWKHSSRVQLCCCWWSCCFSLTLSASSTTSSWMLPNKLRNINEWMSNNSFRDRHSDEHKANRHTQARRLQFLPNSQEEQTRILALRIFWLLSKDRTTSAQPQSPATQAGQ